MEERFKVFPHVGFFASCPCALSQTQVETAAEDYGQFLSAS